MAHASVKWIGMTDDLRGKAAPLLRSCFASEQTIKSAHLSIYWETVF